jgi:formate C-acetyltransferase
MDTKAGVDTKAGTDPGAKAGAGVRIDPALLGRIDELGLSEANEAWRREMKAFAWRIYADRERWTVQSWRETEGEDLQMRRAKLLGCVLDNLEIKIHPFDEIVGRPTPGVIGCATAFDCCGDYIPGIWGDGGVIEATLDASAQIGAEDLAILRESARLFGGHSAPEMTYKAWHELVGSWAKDVEAAKLKDPSLDVAITGQSTSTLSWHKILTVGLRGYIEECKGKIDRYLAEQGRDVDKIYFWRSAILSLETTIAHAKRYAALARSMAEAEADGAQRIRLLEIARVCERVPEHPAGSFHEALQSMQFCNLSKMLENPAQNNCHWGRADQYLYPFFKADLARGVPLETMASQLADLIGRWGTQTFVAAETQRESHQINFGINNVMVGGLGRDGEDKSNELSYLFLHMIALLQLSSPTVGLRWNRKTPQWMMEKSIRTNMATKGGIPLFENDETVIPSYVRDGIPFEEAVEWGGLGCIYPCIPTRAEHYGAEGVAAFNLAGLLHLALHDGVDVNGRQTGLKTGDPRGFASFEELYTAFIEQHRFLVHRVLWLGHVALGVQQKYLRLPLLSILGIEASMDLGQDLLVPHPDFAMFGISDRAIVDAADSLTAVKRMVYEDGILTMDELLDALDSDFVGARGEEIRQTCLRQPKYGNDDEEADAMVCRVNLDSAASIQSFDNAPYRQHMIAREGLAWHYYGGLGAGALPNGRKAFEALNDGSMSPMRMADKNGPTAVLRSARKVGFDDVSYASVLNQKFSSAILRSDESLGKLVAYTNAYMGDGGSHIQYNIVDTEQLKEAQKNPERHGDLIVRIGGFSAYFTQLSESIQNDVIYRSEFDL